MCVTRGQISLYFKPGGSTHIDTLTFAAWSHSHTNASKCDTGLDIKDRSSVRLSEPLIDQSLVIDKMAISPGNSASERFFTASLSLSSSVSITVSENVVEDTSLDQRKISLMGKGERKE